MKKILLVLLLVFSLQAESVCMYWFGKQQSSLKLLSYAIDRDDSSDVVRYAKNALRQTEYIGAECVGADKELNDIIDKEVTKIRKSLKLLIKNNEG